MLSVLSDDRSEVPGVYTSIVGVKWCVCLVGCNGNVARSRRRAFSEIKAPVLSSGMKSRSSKQTVGGAQQNWFN